MSDQSTESVTQKQAITAFALGALFFFYAFVQRVSPSVMTSELMNDFAVGGAALGSLSAFYFYTYASIQLPVGMLTDRFGPRKLMSVAAALCALASVGFALSDSVLTASLGRALIGGTVAFGFVGTMAIAGYWFKPAQYALLAGYLQMMGMLGAIFGQAPLRLMVELLSWRGMMVCLAIIALLLSVCLYTLIPARSSDQKKQPTGRGVMQGLGEVAGNRQTWICSLIGFGMAATMLAFGGLWGVPWLSSVLGFSTAEAAGICSMLFVGWAIFSPITGWASDRLGRRNPILMLGATISLCAMSILVYLTPSQAGWLMFLIFLVGAGGSGMTICFGSVRELNNLNNSSTALGLMNMCIVGSGAVMQPLIGWLLDLNWDGAIIEGARVYSGETYRIAFTSLLLVNLSAILAMFFLRETRCQQLESSV